MSSGSRHPVHLVVPSVSDPAIAKGGLSLYRGLAIAASLVGPTTCYELGPRAGGPPPWSARAVDVRRFRTADQLLRALAAVLTSGARVVKLAGALGIDVDWRADLRIAALARRRRAGCAYADADASYRLPHLDPSQPLAAALRHYSAVIVFGGGPRAVREYAALCGSAPPAVRHISPAIAGLATGGPGAGARREAGTRDVDLLVPVAASSAREGRIRTALDRWAAEVPGLGVALAGDWPPVSASALRLTAVGQCDPARLAAWYGRSRFTLNALRHEFAGYSDTAAPRLFEASLSESVVITEPFPGLANHLQPATECLVAEDVGAVAAMTRLEEDERDRLGRNARLRAQRERAAAAAAFRDVLLGMDGRDAPALAAGAMERSLEVPGRSRLGWTVALLPGLSGEFRRALAARLPSACLVEVDDLHRLRAGDAEAIAVSCAAKERVDRELRLAAWRPRAVFVDVLDEAAARAARWIPGRDWLLPGRDRWPWLE